jgi:biotin transporter BioY
MYGVSFWQGLTIGAVPFVPLDIAKIAAAALVTAPIKRRYITAIGMAR